MINSVDKTPYIIIVGNLRVMATFVNKRFTIQIIKYGVLKIPGFRYLDLKFKNQFSEHFSRHWFSNIIHCTVFYEHRHLTGND